MSVETDCEPSSSVLKDLTRDLHIRAERSGFVAEMLRGRANKSGYVLYLRNLLPAYEQLELGLDRHRDTPAIRELALNQVYRSRALAVDLGHLQGDDWRTDLPLLPAGQRYAECVAQAAEGDGDGLIDHAYVRYFGDLNGGQILKRLLSKTLHLGPESLSFYEFPAIGDLAAFARSYREALDHSIERAAHWGRVTQAALQGFLLNIDLSEAVQRAA